ncbi:hypothetical protein R6Q59_023779 [Mikania micrantha]
MSNYVRMVGIWGLGGGGKTTLASSLYMEISQHFQGHCLVENIREETSKHSLNKLQENMLSAIFKKKGKIFNVTEGKNMMKSMLCRRKVLVILDDVDKLGQLEALAGKHNWFGSGNRIIITTRDQHLLRTHKVDHVYPIRLLSNDDANQLFKRHAYNEEDPVEDYETLSLRVISYASGLPLALRVIGSFLYDKNKNEWISALDKLKDISDLTVMDFLKLSFDGLEAHQKELFLDIACFFRFQSSDDAMEIFEACGYHPEIGIKVLIQKALVTIVYKEFLGNVLDMHDLVEEMGHYIVRREHPGNPRKHSRVWKREEIKEMCFGDATMENDKTEGLKYYVSDSDDNDLSSRFCKIVSSIKKLRWVKLTTIKKAIYYLVEAVVAGTWKQSPAARLESGNRGAGRSKLVRKEAGVRAALCGRAALIGGSWLPAGRRRDSGEWEAWVWKRETQERKGFEVPFFFLLFSNRWAIMAIGLGMEGEHRHLPQLKVLHLEGLKLQSTPDFHGLPRLQNLTLEGCYDLEEIHPSFGSHTSLEYLNVSDCPKL